MAQITTEFRQSALRRGVVVRVNRDAVVEPKLLQAATLEMANLGFFVTPDALSGMTADALSLMLSDARTLVAADRNMTPIYPGFPQQVEAIDTLTLLVEQILHYWTAGAFLPNYPTIVREGLPLEDMVRSLREVKVLKAAAAARELTEELTTSPIALSEDDKALLRGALNLQRPTLEQVVSLTATARNGENLQSFVKEVVALNSFAPTELLSAVAPSCGNADQLLRVVLAIASSPAAEKWESNYALAVDTLADRTARAVRMKKISRPARRAITSRLGEVTHDFKADSLVARQELWRTVMRAVHPYDFKLDESSKRAADIIHSNGEYRTLNSLVEGAMASGDVATAVELLAEHQPGNLLRRIVALLRLVKNERDAKALATAVELRGGTSPLTTLISAYNGVIAANDDHARVTRVAGLTNTMVERKEVVKVADEHLARVAEALKVAMGANLRRVVPTAPVGVDSTQAMPLVRRDAATADRAMTRGEKMTMAGEGDTLRIFGHWNNNQQSAGYMDIGAVALSDSFESLAVCTWDTWNGAREWATYSGDCLVQPGGDAAEYVDVKLAKLKALHPKAKWVAMTVQSWTGWPMADVDFIAGAMLRSDAEKGEVFDARTVATAFKPTTTSTQAVPFAVNLETGELVWIDSSNGSTSSGVSSSRDTSIGSIVYDELERPRLSMGELAALWAKVHGVETVDEPVNEEALMELLG